MATAEEVREFRFIIGDITAPYQYSDEEIQDFLGSYAPDGDMERAGYLWWSGKAAETAEYTNVTEGTSTRALSQIHENAIAMARWYGDRSGESGDNRTPKGARVRKIVRMRRDEGDC